MMLSLSHPSVVACDSLDSKVVASPKVDVS